MANLRADLSSNRMLRRGSQVHRLGDHWVTAKVASWDYTLDTQLNADGTCSIFVQRLPSSVPVLLYRGPIEDLFAGKVSIKLPEVPTLPKRPKRTRKSVLEQDMNTWLEEEAG